MKRLFEAARLKIKRAKQNINDIDALLRDSLAKYAYSISVEYNANIGCDLIRLKAPRMTPDEFSPLLATALHNLRTALDSAWLDVAFDSPSVIEFPVYQTRNDLESAAESTLKHQAPEHIINFLMEVIQPYEGGDGEPIWALHGLDIKAQHGRSLHLDYQFIQGIRAIDDRGEEFAIPDLTFVPPHSFARRCDGRRNVKITDNGKPMLSVTFNDRLPMEGQLILPAIGELAVFVSGTIDCIEAAFFAE